MIKKTENQNYIKLIYTLFIIIISSFFIWLIWPFISDVILKLVFAFLFTSLLLSSVDSLERKIKNRGMSVLVVTFFVIFVIGIFLTSFISQLSNQASEFSQRVNPQTLTQEFNNLGNKFTESLPDFASNFIPSNNDFAITLSKFIDSALNSLASLAGAVGGFLINAIMILIFTIILLSEYHSFRKTLVAGISNKFFESGLKLIFNIEQSVSSYLRGQFIAAFSVGLMSILGLVILNLIGANISLIIFIGIIAGVANLIPLVGPFVGMIPAILIAFMNNIGNEIATSHLLFGIIPSPFFIFDIILMFMIVQQIEGTMITPAIMGKSVGLHPLMIMISLLIGGTILGPLGMLFAVPATAILKIIFQEIMFVRKNSHLL